MKCKRCGFESEELIWDKAYHEISGKWRLYHDGQGRPHECQTQPIVEEETVTCKKLFCGKKMKKSKLQDHVMKEHIDWGDYQ